MSYVFKCDCCHKVGGELHASLPIGSGGELSPVKEAPSSNAGSIPQIIACQYKTVGSSMDVCQTCFRRIRAAVTAVVGELRSMGTKS